MAGVGDDTEDDSRPVIAVDEDLAELLDAAAKKRGVTVAQLIREAIEKYTQDPP